MIECKICHKTFNSSNGLSHHIGQKHKFITKKEYYDAYIGKCVCSLCKINEPEFLDLTRGYRVYCKDCVSIVRALNTSVTKKKWSDEKKAEVKEKRENTMKKKYGITSTFQRPDVIVKSHSKRARRKAKKSSVKTCLEKYGVDNVSKIDEVKAKIKSTCLKNNVYELRAKKTQETKEKRYGNKYYSNINKTKATLKDKYGVDTYFDILNKNGLSVAIRQEKIAQFEKENDCVLVKKLINKYGQGWYKAKIVKPIKVSPQRTYVKNEDIPIIEKYYVKMQLYQSSISEKSLLFLAERLYDGEILSNVRTVIPPYELDIYIPERKLAIEFNGTYYHSIQFGTDENYHLMKSLRCRELGIRLIHIYEFEDFSQQMDLLKNLISGVDRYNPLDFNKNNLLDFIPEPEIIYQGNKYTVYGAGKLYN